MKPHLSLLLAFCLSLVTSSVIATQPIVSSDDNLNMPATWKDCKHSSQCVQIPNGCWFGSVNTKYEKEATAWSIQKAGDPKTLNCYYPRMKKPIFSPVCLKNKCAISIENAE